MATRTTSGQTYTPTTTQPRSVPQVEGLPAGVVWTTLKDGTKVRSDDPRWIQEQAAADAAAREREKNGFQDTLSGAQQGLVDAANANPIGDLRDTATAFNGDLVQEWNRNNPGVLRTPDEWYNAATGAEAGVIADNAKDPTLGRIATDIKNTNLAASGDGVPRPPPAPGTGAAPAPAPAGSVADAEAARKLRDQLLAERNPAPTAAPQVTAPSPINPAQAGAAQQITADKGNTPTIAPIERYGAATVDKTTIDQGPQNQVRDQQTQYIKDLQDAAAGKAPSAAEAQLKRGSEEAIASQFALAGTQHGYGAGAALRAAGRNAAALQQKNNLDTAQVRAQEQATARGQLGGALGQTREQDIGLAGKQADIDAARNQTQAQLEQQARAGNAAAQNELNRRQAELSLQGQTTNAQLGLEAGKANQAAKLQTDLANAGFSQQAILQMSDQELKAKLANAGFTLTQEQINDLRAQNANRNAIDSAGQLLDAEGRDKDRELKRLELQQAYDRARQAGDQAQMNAILSAVASIGIALITASDERLKHDVQRVADSAARRLGEKLNVVKYKYNDGDQSDHVGVMAQQLEKDPLGKTFVHERADGMKAVDYQGLTVALLAAALKGRKVAKRGS